MKKLKLHEKLTGIIPAPYTPVNKDGALNLDCVKLQADYYKRKNINTIFLGGTSGECHSFTVKERISLLEKWADVAGGDFIILFHAGHNCLKEAEELAEAAGNAGADGISVLAPSFFRPEANENLVEWCAAVASKAPDLPFYYYHIPGFTGVDFLMEKFLQLGSKRIPNLNGIKYSSKDLADCLACTQYDNKKYNILYGYDEGLLAGLILDIDGAIGSTYNYAAPLYQRIINAYNNNDIKTARNEQMKSVRLVEVLFIYGVVQTGKTIMSMLGVDCGPVRPPYEPLTFKQRKDVYDRLKPLDIFPEDEFKLV